MRILTKTKLVPSLDKRALLLSRPQQTAQQTIQHIDITMFYSLSTLLRVLAASAATIPFAAAAAQNQTKMGGGVGEIFPLSSSMIGLV
jgi:hypothetical protein